MAASCSGHPFASLFVNAHTFMTSKAVQNVVHCLTKKWHATHGTLHGYSNDETALNTQKGCTLPSSAYIIMVKRQLRSAQMAYLAIINIHGKPPGPLSHGAGCHVHSHSQSLHSTLLGVWCVMQSNQKPSHHHS